MEEETKKEIKSWDKGDKSFIIGFIIFSLIIVSIIAYFYFKDRPNIKKCMSEYSKNSETGLYERWELFEQFKECFSTK